MTEKLIKKCKHNTNLFLKKNNIYDILLNVGELFTAFIRLIIID